MIEQEDQGITSGLHQQSWFPIRRLTEITTQQTTKPIHCPLHNYILWWTTKDYHQNDWPGRFIIPTHSVTAKKWRHANNVHYVVICCERSIESRSTPHLTTLGKMRMDQVTEALVLYGKENVCVTRYGCTGWLHCHTRSFISGTTMANAACSAVLMTSGLRIPEEIESTP